MLVKISPAYHLTREHIQAICQSQYKVMNIANLRDKYDALRPAQY